MPSTKKETSKSVIVIDQVRDYSNDPFVVEKGRRARAFIEKHGFPEAFINQNLKHNR